MLLMVASGHSRNGYVQGRRLLPAPFLYPASANEREVFDLNEKHTSFRQNTARLLWKFLEGSKRFFLASILCAGITALADMVQPQIIRAAVDCAIGGKEGDFPVFVMKAVERIGGFSYLGQNLWIMALAIVAVAAGQVLSSTASGSAIPGLRKRWSRPCGTSSTVISNVFLSPGI